MWNKILAAIDASAEAQDVLQAAFETAKAGNADLTVVTVADIPDWASLYGAESTLRQEGTNKYLPLLLKVQEEARKQQLRVKTELLFGSPAESIINYLKSNQFDLVLLGSKQKSNINRMLLGSVAAKIVFYSPCSVLIIRKALAWRNILAALDSSEDAERALEFAFDLGKDHEVNIEAVAVVAVPHYAGSLGEVETARQQGEQFYTEILARAQWTAKKRKINIKTHILFGDPAERLLQYLTKRPKDVVILGHKGTSRMRDMLLGSTAYKLVNYAPCSVLVIK